MKKKVEVKNLYKVFGKKNKKVIDLLEKGESKDSILNKTKQVVALNNVSLSINDGEIFVVMGLSGSGKSTLIRCINRLIEPTMGQIYLEDEEITNLSHKDLIEIRRKKIGMVFQNFGLFPHINILENVAYGLKIQGVEKSERLLRANEALKSVGLEGWETKYTSQLSGGMQQRVGLARALANDPDILLMDEAFSALDPLIRSNMQDELLEIQSKVNKTIIFITHDLNEALKIGDRIALMKDGEVVQVGTPEEILLKPANEYVRKFINDVDRTKILTASRIMRNPTIVYEIGDSVESIIKKMNKHKFDSIFVVDKNKKLIGLLRKNKINNDVNKEDVINLLDSNFAKIDEDLSIEELFVHLANSNEPIAVTSESDKLKGIIVRSDVIQFLAERGKIDD